MSGGAHAEVLPVGSGEGSRDGLGQSYLQRWFLDTRVGRIRRWHKSQCGRELLSAQMLH